MPITDREKEIEALNEESDRQTRARIERERKAKPSPFIAAPPEADVDCGDAEAPLDPPRLFVLKKRGLYWRPKSAGYADGILYAGTYSDAESASIVRGCSGEVTRIPLEDAFRDAFGMAPAGYLDTAILSLALARCGAPTEQIFAFSCACGFEWRGLKSNPGGVLGLPRRCPGCLGPVTDAMEAAARPLPV